MIAEVSRLCLKKLLVFGRPDITVCRSLAAVSDQCTLIDGCMMTVTNRHAVA